MPHNLTSKPNFVLKLFYLHANEFKASIQRIYWLNILKLLHFKRQKIQFLTLQQLCNLKK